MTTSPHWRRIEALYHEVLSHPEQERAAVLAVACAGDAGLQSEVQSLLEQSSSTDGFLETSPVAQFRTQSAGSALVGRRLGVFEVHALLGMGGMGEVYRARDTRLGRDVAIKILPPEFTADPRRLARFEREARALASLNHPNIGAIYGVEEADDVRALVLELVDGETLADRMAGSPTRVKAERRGSHVPEDSGPTPRAMRIAEALTIASQIASALDVAHERGIVHRDLKPANIMITAEGVVKVLDFGLATSAAGVDEPAPTMRATHEGMILGTAPYMSPEQARGQTVDKRTDIWAFGCILYEMLTGRPAFDGETFADAIAAVLEQEPDWTLVRQRRLRRFAGSRRVAS